MRRSFAAATASSDHIVSGSGNPNFRNFAALNMSMALAQKLFYGPLSSTPRSEHFGESPRHIRCCSCFSDEEPDWIPSSQATRLLLSAGHVFAALVTGGLQRAIKYYAVDTTDKTAKASQVAQSCASFQNCTGDRTDLGLAVAVSAVLASTREPADCRKATGCLGSLPGFQSCR